MTRQMIRIALEQGGHMVLDAVDGYECLERVKNAQPDMLIVDVFMPEMDGLEVVAEIKVSNPGLKIIGISSGCPRMKTKYLDIIKNLGADTILSKPIKAADLLEAVGSLLGALQTA